MVNPCLSSLNILLWISAAQVTEGHSHAHACMGTRPKLRYLWYNPETYAREVGAECCDTQNFDASPIRHVIYEMFRMADQAS